MAMIYMVEVQIYDCNTQMLNVWYPNAQCMVYLLTP